MTTDEVKESKGAKNLCETFQHEMLEPLRRMILEELEGIEVCFWLDYIEVYLHGNLLTHDSFDDLFEKALKDSDFSDSEERKWWLDAAKGFEDAAATIREMAKQKKP